MQDAGKQASAEVLVENSIEAYPTTTYQRYQVHHVNIQSTNSLRQQKQSKIMNAISMRNAKMQEM